MEKRPWIVLEDFADTLDTYRKSHLDHLSPRAADYQSDLSILARTQACQQHTEELKAEIEQLSQHHPTSTLPLPSPGGD